MPDELVNLKELNLYHNHLTSLTILENWLNLKELCLWKNQLSELTLPVNLAGLVMSRRYNQPTLYLYNNPIKQLFIHRLMNIGKLSIDGFSQEEITFCGEGKPFITTGTKIDGTRFRKEVSRYNTSLYFEGNQLVSLTLSPGLANLGEFNLGNNPIE